MRRCLSWLHTLGLSLWLVGCSNAPPAPIEDHSRDSDRRSTVGRNASASTHNVASRQNYVVLTGDTLYSIAFRYGLDFRRLAAANAISAPFTIFPGQSLVLREAEPATASTSSARPPSSSSATSSVSNANSSTASSGKTSTAKTSTAASTAAVSPAPKKTPASIPKTTSKPEATPSPTSNVAVSRWRWPAQGKLSRRFDGTLHKGIDISGARGDAVTATAGGRVVYAGSGIAGYGRLLILRHNDEYLSAYGHNDSLLVTEGDTVKVGQTIATRGSSGTDSVKLHFEIRRRGRPVDPLGLLPKR